MFWLEMEEFRGPDDAKYGFGSLGLEERPRVNDIAGRSIARYGKIEYLQVFKFLPSGSYENTVPRQYD
jgi:hypothetical protein